MAQVATPRSSASDNALTDPTQRRFRGSAKNLRIRNHQREAGRGDLRRSLQSAQQTDRQTLRPQKDPHA